jgi:hypothetical protein
MANVIYNNFKKELLGGNIDLDSDSIKVALVSSSYTPDADQHDFFNDVTNEVSGTGYSAGGEALVNPSLTIDTDNDRVKFDADDVAWESSTITARGAVVYKSTGDASTSPLMLYLDFGTNRVSSNSTFTLQWDSAGILRLA